MAARHEQSRALLDCCSQYLHVVVLWQIQEYSSYQFTRPFFCAQLINKNPNSMNGIIMPGRRRDRHRTAHWSAADPANEGATRVTKQMIPSKSSDVFNA